MAESTQAGEAGLAEPIAMETTTSLLLLRIRQGDDQARDLLIERYLPALRRWAHGHVPPRVRSVMESEDLVHDTPLRALDHLEGFVPERKGSFLAYLRRIMQNAIRDELRRLVRRPPPEPLKDIHPDAEPSPLRRAIGAEALAAFDAGMVRLSPEQQEAIFLRIELGFTHQEVADALGLPTANAARMLVSRALVRLAELMDEEQKARARQIDDGRTE